MDGQLLGRRVHDGATPHGDLVGSEVPVKRREMGKSACPIDRSLSEVGDAWTLQILRDALQGITRFTDFNEQIGAASNILSARLQKLVAVGIFKIHESTLGNSREYVLTEKGRDFHTALSALRQ
ncbi:helix-turn-helix domain-containing protein [Streptomyces sp. NPDC052107]|uniref:winged helix-turn-helix transcriptional regulator n=1 Tax=Streptomyces sp. NPDC052107 TaxID=3155632 RepID=UPI003417ADD0